MRVVWRPPLVEEILSAVYAEAPTGEPAAGGRPPTATDEYVLPEILERFIQAMEGQPAR